MDGRKYRVTLELRDWELSQMAWALEKGALALKVTADEQEHAKGWEYWCKENRDCAFYLNLLKVKMTGEYADVVEVE